MRDYHAVFEPGYYYHIYNRGNNGERIFETTGNYEYFLKKLIAYICPYLDIYAYCLMPNHFHLLVKVKSLSTFEQIFKADTAITINNFLAEKFQRFFSSYVLAFNTQQRRSGSLFEKRFKRLLVTSDEYYSKLIHYIHNNPIHHHLVNEYSLWKFSSYNTILSDKPTLVKRAVVLEWFGGKENFTIFHQSNIDYGEIRDLLTD